VLRDPKWYIRFSSAALKYGCSQQWATFRREKLIDALNSSLRDLAIPTPTLARKAAQYADAPAKSPVQLRGQLSPPASDEAGFRDLVRKVVLEMPLNDLRALKLPVGIVFDALKR
jgi:hypothetical protein